MSREGSSIFEDAHRRRLPRQQIRRNYGEVRDFLETQRSENVTRSLLASTRAVIGLGDTPGGHRAAYLARMKEKCRHRGQRILQNFFENSTFHGIFEIYFADNKWLRGFWVLAFIAALGASVYGCCAIVMSYTFSPVAVSYVVREFEDAVLPDVVVCPFNRFNQSFLNESEIGEDLTTYIELAFGFSGKLYEFQQAYRLPGNMQELQRRLDDTLDKYDMTFEEFVHNASITCESLIPYCVTADRKGPFDCCSDATAVMTSVGKCFRILGIRQNAAGYGFGLTIYITLPVQFFTPAINNLHNEGIAVKLVEKGNGLDYDISFVPSGVHALMAVRATKFEFINDPPRYECLPQSQGYSRIECFANCIFAAGNRDCNCSHLASEDQSYPPCNSVQFYYCLIPVTQGEFQREPDRIQTCQQRCKPLCTYWQYSSAVSYARIPSPTIRTFLKSDEEYEKMKDTIILDVFYERLEYHMIQHFPTKTADTFIANLGGQLGLWVGGSILTLLQVVVCSCQLIYHKVRPVTTATTDTIRRMSRKRPSVAARTDFDNRVDQRLNSLSDGFRSAEIRQVFGQHHGMLETL